MEAKVGRPRQFRNGAERQKAYRERKKADQEAIDHAIWVMSLVEEREQTLRNLLKYWTRKRGNVILQVSDYIGEYAQILVDGHVTNTVHWLVAQSMIRRGELELVRKDWSSRFYRLNDTEK